VSSLNGKVALITGAGRPRGIGRASALQLARAGADVAVTDLVRNNAEQQSLDAVVAEIRSAGGSAVGIAMDVTDRARISDCVARIHKQFGAIDILFNNAGSPVGVGPFLELTDTQWDVSYQVHIKGMVDVCREVIPIMQRRGGGVIINNASLAGLGAEPLMAAYTATKFGAVGLTKAIACEFGGDGIRCNAICPGMVNTEMGDAEVELFRAPGQSAADVRKALAQNISLQQRWADPEEIAEVVVFLAGPQASYLTGVALPVAGGLPAGL
jgi:NAD(P)-dependent dehydrogenase (short-subunit alcohol dehydrogenase family)